MYNIKKDFTQAVFAKKTPKQIQAVFADGSTAIYTTAILPLLTSDKDIKSIIDIATGEIIFFRS